MICDLTENGQFSAPEPPSEFAKAFLSSGTSPMFIAIEEASPAQLDAPAFALLDLADQTVSAPAGHNGLREDEIQSIRDFLSDHIEDFLESLEEDSAYAEAYLILPDAISKTTEPIARLMLQYHFLHPGGFGIDISSP